MLYGLLLRTLYCYLKLRDLVGTSHKWPFFQGDRMSIVINRKSQEGDEVQLGVFADSFIVENTKVLEIVNPEILAGPTKHTVRLYNKDKKEYEHLLCAAAKFLNHSCKPTAKWEGHSLVTTTNLQPGEEVTFDYYTTELEITSPFTCNCNSFSCKIEIK